MKLLIPLLLLCAALNVQGQTDWESKSLAFVKSLKDADFDASSQFFSEELRPQIPSNALSQIWDQLLGNNGKLKKYRFNCLEADHHSTVAYITCDFKKASIDFKLIFNAEGYLESFLLVPIHTCVESTPKHDWKAPDYDRPELYTTQEFEINNDGYSLPGTILFPEEDKGILVIFVHGSGPNDRDESMGPNKVFKDLAIGLAVNGITTLRYDKRTFANRFRDPEKITIYNEVTDDVLALVDWASEQDSLKNKKIVLLGHSLGGMAVPYCGVQSDKVDGLIIMAGPTSRFEDLLVYQYEYLFKLDGKMSDAEKAELDKITKAAKVCKSVNDSTPASDLPLGLPASYWMSLEDFIPTKHIVRFNNPILVMNGERDYQVPLSEFDRWKSALANRDDVRFAAFMRLNHLFLEGEGEPSPEEYQVVSHVPIYVIQELTSWLNELK